MSQEEFAKNVLSSGILTDAEVLSFFKKFNGIDVADLKWKEKGNRSVCKLSFNRFDILGAWWGYDGVQSDALTLCANKAVLFHGVHLFGNCRGSKYEVKFAIKDETVTGTYTSEQDNHGVWGYDVMLPKPISLLPNEEVTIIATIKGPPSLKGCIGKSSMKVDDIIVTFKDVSLDNARQNYGQFYKIYLSEL